MPTTWPPPRGDQQLTVEPGGAWTDKVVLSADGTLGNQDDIVVANLAHEGAIAASESYTRNERFQLPIGLTGRYRLYVIADTRRTWRPARSWAST